jgi:predicted nucleotidyltransferase component of viral defense system
VAGRTEPLSRERAKEWALQAQLAYLSALAVVAEWGRDELAFHGGTSLHLAWGSPRHSEDLDFLLTKSAAGVDKVARAIGSLVIEQFRAHDSNFEILVSERSKAPARMLSYEVSVRHPTFRGSVMVKAEFWRVASSYLQSYPTVLRTPIVAVGDARAPRMSPICAAALETAYADKLTALATRPYLKWRDLYDLWWIGTQTRAALSDQALSAQLLHNISAYQPLGGLSPAGALRQFCAQDRRALLAKADSDLRPWLPSHVLRALGPKGPAEIIDYVLSSVEAVADRLDEPQPRKPKRRPK